MQDDYVTGYDQYIEQFVEELRRRHYAQIEAEVLNFVYWHDRWPMHLFTHIGLAPPVQKGVVDSSVLPELAGPWIRLVGTNEEGLSCFVCLA